jgi:hypothetical protein
MLAQRDAEDLACFLALPPAELLRPLSTEEFQEWRFYRLSAANRPEVWRRATGAWRSAGLTQRQAAAVMQLPVTTLAHGQEPDTVRILAYPPALRLADACQLEDGVETFVAGLTLDGLSPR